MLGDALLQLVNEEQAPIPRRRRRRPGLKFIGAAMLLVIIVTSAVTVAWVVHNQSSAIPQSILNQLDFTPLILNQKQGLVIDSSTYKYNPEEIGISFVATSQQSGKLTISEQATPQEFIDIPDVYSKLVDNMNRYSVFQNPLGTVYLTRPNDQADGQTAVINAGGVLMFARSSKDLTDNQWRQIFTSFASE